MRKILPFVLVLMVATMPAWATGPEIKQGYYTVAWELPEEGKWPQTLQQHVGPFEGPALDVLDEDLAEECGVFQVDVYKIDSEKDEETLAWLITKGTLELNEAGLPEDNKIYHSSKLVEGEECESETTTTIGTTTTSEGSTTTTTTPSSTTTTTMESTTTSIGTTSSSMSGSSSTAPTDTTGSSLGTLPETGIGDWIPVASISLFGLGILVLLGSMVMRDDE